MIIIPILTLKRFSRWSQAQVVTIAGHDDGVFLRLVIHIRRHIVLFVHHDVLVGGTGVLRPVVL